MQRLEVIASSGMGTVVFMGSRLGLRCTLSRDLLETILDHEWISSWLGVAALSLVCSPGNEAVLTLLLWCWCDTVVELLGCGACCCAPMLALSGWGSEKGWAYGKGCWPPLWVLRLGVVAAVACTVDVKGWTGAPRRP